MKTILSNVRYLLLIVIISSIGYLLQSCSNENDSSLDTPIDKVLSTDDAQQKAFKYLYLEENQYTLKLSKEEAKKINISEKDYLNIVNDIDAVNSHLSKLSGDELKRLDLVNPQEISDSYLKQAINERKQGALTKVTRASAGVISTNGQDWGYNSFEVPAGTSKVNVTCNAVGFIQVFNVSAKTCGNTAVDGGVGALGKWSTTLKLYCSGKNVYCTMGFKTANSNGGVCNYKW